MAISDPKILEERVFTILPYTYTYRGAGAFGFELRDERNRWLGVWDSVAGAEAAAAEHGAVTRKSWDPNPNAVERVPAERSSIFSGPGARAGG